MSALTDFFSNLAGKIRSKLGTSRTYTPAEAVAAIDDVYNKGVTDTKKGNAERSHVLSPKTFTSLSAGVNQTGSMPDKSGWKSTGHNLNSKTVQQVSIPAGYHNGSGYVEFNSLSSQTGVDSGKLAIIAGAIKSGYQGWVNGEKITGTLSLSGDAASNHVLSGKTFYNNTWTKQSGQMPNRGTIPTKYLNGGETYTIPDGYHSGSGKVIANTVGDQTKVDPGKTAIDPGAVKAGYQGWVNGQKITGTLSLSGNAPNGYVLSGYTFYNNTWTKQTGSMPSRSSSSQVPENKAWHWNNRIYFGVEYGYYPAASYGNMSNVSEKYITYDALARDIGVNTSNMLSGYSILGKEGTITRRAGGGSWCTGAGRDEIGGYVYFEPGYYPAGDSYGSYVYLHDGACRAVHAHHATYTPNNGEVNSSAVDMGEKHDYRYFNSAVCYKAGNDYGTWIMDNRWLSRRARYQGRIIRDNQQWIDTFDGIVIVFCGNSTNISIDWNYSGGISGESRISGSTQWGWSFLSFRASGNFWFMVRNGEGEVFYIQ